MSLTARETQHPPEFDPIMDTRVSRFDRVCGMLLALVVVFSTGAGMLFLVWLTQTVSSQRHVAVSQPLIELPKGPTEVGQLQFAEVGGDELPDVPGSQFSEALATVSTSVTYVDGQGLLKGDGDTLGRVPG